jgi:hypothetical protein
MNLEIEAVVARREAELRHAVQAAAAKQQHVLAVVFRDAGVVYGLARVRHIQRLDDWIAFISG